MSVIRGKLFTDREIVPTTKTVGSWPLVESSTKGKWTGKDDKDQKYKEISLDELFRDLEKFSKQPRIA